MKNNTVIWNIIKRKENNMRYSVILQNKVTGIKRLLTIEAENILYALCKAIAKQVLYEKIILIKEKE